MSKTKTDPIIIGRRVWVDITNQSGDTLRCIAKIDTGAFSSSIDLAIFDELKLKTTKRDKVTNANGESERDYTPIKLKIKGIEIKTVASVANRSNLNNICLIGRKDLKKFKFLINPRRTIKTPKISMIDISNIKETLDKIPNIMVSKEKKDLVVEKSAILVEFNQFIADKYQISSLEAMDKIRKPLMDKITELVKEKKKITFEQAIDLFKNYAISEEFTKSDEFATNIKDLFELLGEFASFGLLEKEKEND